MIFRSGCPALLQDLLDPESEKAENATNAEREMSATNAESGVNAELTVNAVNATNVANAEAGVRCSEEDLPMLVSAALAAAEATATLRLPGTNAALRTRDFGESAPRKSARRKW